MTEQTIRETANIMRIQHRVAAPVDDSGASARMLAWAPARRQAYYLSDPSFGWLVTKSYAESKTQLPAGIKCPAIVQAYAHLIDRRDQELEDLIAVTFPGQERRRSVLEALLLCRDLEYEAIAKLVHIDVQSLQTYNDLFFNVRDRLDDASYISEIVYPGGRPDAHRAKRMGILPLRKLLLIAAYEEGAGSVTQLAGLKPEAHDDTAKGLMKTIELQLLRQAADSLAFGDPESPVVHHAVRLMQAEKKVQQESTSSDQEMGLTALGSMYSITDTILQMQRPDMARRLAAQRSIAEQKLNPEKKSSDTNRNE